MDKYINTIIEGDCLEVMKSIADKSVDLILTDPPYGINIGSSTGGAKPFGKNRGTKSIAPKSYRGFNDTKPPSKDYFTEMMRISKNQIIFGGNYFIENLYASPCWIVWDKDNSGNFADCELAWTSFKTGVKKYRYRWNGMLQEDMKNKEVRIHPTQKPRVLFKKIIVDYSKEGDTILDPFLGSGTTAVACKELGRKYIGIEIDPEYCKIAEQRLLQDVLF